MAEAAAQHAPGALTGRAGRVGDLLASARTRLRRAGIEDAGLVAEVLLAHVLVRDRVWLYAHPEAEVAEDLARRFAGLVARSARHEPLAYLTGEREFFGRAFLVLPGVLVPRPETEVLVEAALAALRRPHARVVDVGCGSGVIGISVALARRDARVVALDLDPRATRLARRNAQRHGATNVLVVQGDLLGPVRGPVDAVLANLPYLTPTELRRLPAVVRREPRLALSGGQDGLALHRRLLPQARRVLSSGGLCALEIGAHQGPAAGALLQATWPEAKVRLVRDYSGHNRVVVAEC